MEIECVDLSMSLVPIRASSLANDLLTDEGEDKVALAAAVIDPFSTIPTKAAYSFSLDILFFSQGNTVFLVFPFCPHCCSSSMPPVTLYDNKNLAARYV